MFLFFPTTEYMYICIYIYVSIHWVYQESWPPAPDSQQPKVTINLNT